MFYSIWFVYFGHGFDGQGCWGYANQTEIVFLPNKLDIDELVAPKLKIQFRVKNPLIVGIKFIKNIYKSILHS